MTRKNNSDNSKSENCALDRRKVLLGTTTFAAASALAAAAPAQVAQAQQRPVAPAPARRRLLGFERFGPGAVPGSIDAAVSYGRIDQNGVPRTASGGAAPLPPDLLTMPRPRGEPQSNRPSPMIWARDDGGVVGLSYKIKP